MKSLLLLTPVFFQFVVSSVSWGHTRTLVALEEFSSPDYLAIANLENKEFFESIATTGKVTSGQYVSFPKNPGIKVKIQSLGVVDRFVFTFPAFESWTASRNSQPGNFGIYLGPGWTKLPITTLSDRIRIKVSSEFMDLIQKWAKDKTAKVLWTNVRAMQFEQQLLSSLTPEDFNRRLQQELLTRNPFEIEFQVPTTDFDKKAIIQAFCVEIIDLVTQFRSKKVTLLFPDPLSAGLDAKTLGNRIPFYQALDLLDKKFSEHFDAAQRYDWEQLLTSADDRVWRRGLLEAGLKAYFRSEPTPNSCETYWVQPKARLNEVPSYTHQFYVPEFENKAFELKPWESEI